jgi:hypothetical protein
MRIFLDPASRALVCTSHESSSLLPDISGLLEVRIDDATWHSDHLPAWQAAHAAGQDLIVRPDLSHSATAHAPRAAEQKAVARGAALKAFAHNPNPSAADRDAAIRALIQHLELDI